MEAPYGLTLERLRSLPLNQSYALDDQGLALFPIRESESWMFRGKAVKIPDIPGRLFIVKGPESQH